ncbi:glutamate--tRNA ligase, chloroplastic/mitochondrial-like isoform X1 [Senna tora]|uniref:Glutamate--tRNA ligase, chloroplastic/mitochondrial-like isoform X1 n=1 Tax=Senna tora TaxID=362788 RepID=A0A834T0I6_9FABA|nr:glutamate--tRNA ligase, chloroplastic/mitochondrial-like isoform X1 [Senna tora]
MYKSIEHRAIVNSEKERISVATFFSPKMDGEMGPAKSLVFQYSSGIRMAMLGGTPWTRIRAFSFEVAPPILHQSSLYYRQRIIPFRKNFSVSTFSVPEQKAEGAVRVQRWKVYSEN